MGRGSHPASISPAEGPPVTFWGNLVTPEDLTGGRIIAGTGTVNLDGTVGPVGGLRQKVAGAELSGATYFLVPQQNYEDARAAARRIEVIQVGTVEEAIYFLQSLPSV